MTSEIMGISTKPKQGRPITSEIKRIEEELLLRPSLRPTDWHDSSVRLLWVAVLQQALQDIKPVKIPKRCKPSKRVQLKRRQQLREAAIHWFYSDSVGCPSFDWICRTLELNKLKTLEYLTNKNLRLKPTPEAR
jgi:hypothetical protein